MNYIVSNNPIKVFEKQSGLIRLLIYLVEHELINVKSVIENTNIYSNIMYAFLQKVKKLSLISTKYDRHHLSSMQHDLLYRQSCRIFEKD